MKGDKGMSSYLPRISYHLTSAEFSGTLLGFDDYVSELMHTYHQRKCSNVYIDMVLEDVTEL